MDRKNMFLLTSVAVLLIAHPLIFIGGEFQGADFLAEELISSINPDFHPWLEKIFPELSGEMETFLFSFQAAAGAGIAGYILGNMRGRVHGNKKMHCPG